MDEKTKRILDSNEVDKIVFYTGKSQLVNNLFTVCLFINKRLERIQSRGVAICSLMDSYSKKKGKQKAFGRAVAALTHQKNMMKIKSNTRNDEFITRKMKIKSKDDEANLIHELTNELAYFQEDINIKFIQNPGDKYPKCIFSLPLSYPIKATNNHFKYKAQYLPEPANQEERYILAENSIFTEPIDQSSSKV